MMMKFDCNLSPSALLHVLLVALVCSVLLLMLPVVLLVVDSENV